MPGNDTDIRAWLEDLGLAEYAEVFVEQRIGLDVLKDLDDADLKDLGVVVGDRKRLRRAIENVGEATAESPVSPAPAMPIRSERRHVTIMFVDMGASTELSTRLDPEDYAQTIKRFQSQAMSLIETWQGFVARFFGDGILAYFGWPKANENDAERAARAALQISKQISGLRAEDGSALWCRIGIATGLVVVEDIVGNRMSFQDSIYGVTPNLAARLQSCAKPGEVIISSDTRRLLHNWFDTSLQGQAELKGIDGAVEVWRIDGIKQRSTRFEARADQSLLSPLAGREAELTRLQQLWDKAAQGEGSAVLIKGDAGFGKSRLIQEFTRRSVPTASNTIYLQCSPFHQHTAAYPIVECLTARTGITELESKESALEKIAFELAAADVTEPDSAALISRFIGVRGGDEGVESDISPALYASRSLDILARYLVGLSGKTPLTLIVEDAHWIDPTTVLVIDRLLELLEKHAMFVIVTARPGFDPDWCQADHQLIELPTLDPGHAGQLTVAVAGGLSLPDEISAIVFDATNGVPLFIEEVTRMLIESGHISLQNQALVLNSVIEEISIPATLKDSLAAKIDAVPDAKPLACLCSILGREFSYESIRTVSTESEHETDEHLGQLIDSSVLILNTSGSSQKFAFTHAMMHEAAYSMLLHADRRALHLRIARALETQSATLSHSSPQILAHHFERAEYPTAAASYLLLAGERALEVSATAEALAQLTRGIELLEPLARKPKLDQLLLRLHASIGTAHMLARGWGAPEVEQAYASALNLRGVADANERLWVTWGAWVYQQVSGRIGSSTSLADEILRIAQDAEDPDALLVAHMIQLQRYFYQGQFITALEHGAQLLKLYDSARHSHLKNSYSIDLLLVWHVHAAQARWILGDSVGARREYETARKIAAELNHAHSLAWTLTWGANYLLLDKQFDRILDTVPEGLDIAQSRGFGYPLSLGRIILTEAQQHVADATTDFSASEEALAEFLDTGAGIAAPYFLTRQASALAAAGEYVVAQEKIDLALAQIAKWGERWSESFTLRVCGDILLRSANADPAGAESNYRDAIAVAIDQGAVRWRLEASVALGRLLLGQNRDSEAALLYTKLKDDRVLEWAQEENGNMDSLFAPIHENIRPLI